jgi:hypothetical protein
LKNRTTGNMLVDLLKNMVAVGVGSFLGGGAPDAPNRALLGTCRLCRHQCSGRPYPHRPGIYTFENSIRLRLLNAKTKKDSNRYSFFFHSGKREFNLCSLIILSAKILRFFRFTFEFPSNSFGRFSGTGIAALCPP